jgi:ribosome-binding factor A
MPRRVSPRGSRLAEQIQHELAEAIRAELKDPKVGFVTLTGVEVSPDHSHAKVFFTVFGDAAGVEETRRALTRAAGFLRSQLARALTTRTVPELHFLHDASVERGMHLSKLIDEAVASDRRDEASADTASEETSGAGPGAASDEPGAGH